MSSLDVRSIDDKQLRKQPSPAVKHEFRVFLSEAAFDRAVERGDGDVTREIGGVLVGELLRDDAGPYLRIDATIDALHAEEKGAELTFTHATWEHIHKEMDGKHQDKKVVGWYHTHPGFGVFLSDRDQFIHKSFFNLPFQVAFVYDPKSHEHGMFTWHESCVRRARRYWIGAREQVWDGPRAPVDTQVPKPEAGKREAERDDGGVRRVQDGSSQDGPLGMFVVVGLVLLLLGGVVGHWWGTRSTADEAQRAVVVASEEGMRRAVDSLQNDVLGILRATIGDEAVRRPVAQAIALLDQMIAALPVDVAPAPAVAGPGTAAPAGPGAAAPVRGGSGSAAPATPPTGPAPGSTAPGAAPGSAAPAGAGAVAPGADPRWAAFATQLRAVRASLLKLQDDRAAAQVALEKVEFLARHGSEMSREVVRDLAEQHALLGGLYGDLATDAAKAGDKDRARRLLATAAHVDPGNRARYEKQLQSFDPSGRLPPDTTASTGPAGQGAPR